MKLIVLLIGSFTFISVNGQKIQGKIQNVNFDKDSISSGNRVLEALAFDETNYKFLFSNKKGKVYESTIDHMRCLAPDFPSRMPVAGLPKIKSSKPEQMPNAFSKKHTLPPASLKK